MLSYYEYHKNKSPQYQPKQRVLQIQNIVFLLQTTFEDTSFEVVIFVMMLCVGCFVFFSVRQNK